MGENTLPLEIERKFLIALPDAALLGEKSVKRLAIAQVYLRAGTSGAGRRIRRARCGDETRYYYTEKTRVTAVTRIEREHEIPAAEFEALLSERDEALRTIEKTRWRSMFSPSGATALSANASCKARTSRCRSRTGCMYTVK